MFGLIGIGGSRQLIQYSQLFTFVVCKIFGHVITYYELLIIMAHISEMHAGYLTWYLTKIIKR